MNNFSKYAKFFDLIYKDKDYRKEADYVKSLINRYRRGKINTLLDIGCGTGNHAYWFIKDGYQVAGVDKSERMIAIAKSRFLNEPRAKFYLADVYKFDLRKKFNVAVALFHVMSYLATNDVFMKSLKRIHAHLMKKSLFIFDFWYGPAVLSERPQLRKKRIIEDKLIISRIAVPRTNFNDDTVDIKYKITALNTERGSSEIIKESHKMRYFFLPELDLMLKLSGFKILKSLKWLSVNESLTQESWSGVIVAQRD